MLLLLLLAGILIGNVLLAVLSLWLGARWVKAAKVSFLRAFVVALVLGVVGILLLPVAICLEGLLAHEGAIAILAAEGTFLLGQVLVSWLVIRWLFKTTFLRAIVIWVVNAVAGIAAL